MVLRAFFKRHKKEPAINDVVRQELEAHSERINKSRSDKEREEERRKLWDSLSPRMKRAVLRKAGKYGK